MKPTLFSQLSPKSARALAVLLLTRYEYLASFPDEDLRTEWMTELSELCTEVGYTLPEVK